MNDHVSHWIDGERCAPPGRGGEVGECFDPASGERAGTFSEGGAAEAGAAIEAACRAFAQTGWACAPRLRADVLLDLADIVSSRSEAIARTITRVNGKLLRESAAEVAAAVSELHYYAGLARNVFGRCAQVDTGAFSILAREPAGVAGIIVPWNAPITLLVRSLAPAMAAGCASVVKAAHQTSPATDAFVDCLAQVRDLPRGVVNVVFESGSAAAQELVSSPRVDVISFTGSTAVGIRIMERAAPTLKRLSLELGGKAPAIVFPDCDQDRTVRAVTAAATAMAGQMCTAAARVLVHESIAADMREKLRHAFASVVVGPGSEPASQMGPVIDRRNRDRIAGMVESAAPQGSVIVGGAPMGGKLSAGAFITPALVEIRELDSRFIQEELFGPVLVFETFRDESEAVTRANSTRYGLAASVWTNDHARAHRVARALQSGTVWINSHNRLFAEAETGGLRDSGYGRLHGVEGLDVFLSTKHVYLETGAARSG